ncbi:MAG: hypothetical protein RSC48_02465 [Anaerorhabdus sp.]
MTFLVFVKSNSFQGSYNFCVSKNKIIELIWKINNTANKELIQFKDYDSDSSIRFEEINESVVIVNGLIGGSHNTNYLKFEFNADQTIYYELSKLLQLNLDIINDEFIEDNKRK